LSAVLLWHAAATWFLVGLSWFVGVVHYPLFGAVGRAEHARYHAAHMTRTTWVVAPSMGLELITALWLVFDPPAGVSSQATYLGLGLVAAIWISTALVQVPLHGRIERSLDTRTHRRLVWSHHLRSLLWTARGLLALHLIAQASA
jgi:hypothetical protein